MNAKPVLLLLSVCLLTCFTTFPAVAEVSPTDEGTTLTKVELEAQINTLTERLETLKEAKKQAVDRQEKQQIRQEIRDIKQEAKALKQQVSGGIYIGSGVLLLAILLILLL